MSRTWARQLRFEVNPEWSDVFPHAGSATALVEGEAGTVLHESQRGRARVVEHARARLVIKHSFLERTSRWRRLVSLGRPAEGMRAFRNLQRLRDAKAPVPEPIFGLELRRWGLAADSWHAYCHLEGRPASVKDATRLVGALVALHARGWIHRDPHIGNFLVRDEDVLFLDCSRARPSRSPYSRAFDLVLLEKCCRGLGHHERVLPVDGTLIGLARIHSRALVAWRETKRWVRSVFGRSKQGGIAAP